MTPFVCAVSPESLAAARRLLDRAEQDADDLQRRVAALSAATEWSARAAEGYRTALGDLTALVGTLARLIGVAERDVAALQVSATAGAPCL